MVPPGYLDITGATTSRGAVNVIGIVVDVFGDSQPTSRSSYCATFTIKDSNLDNGNHWDGLRVKYYSSERSSLPPVRNLDVVIIQNIAVKAFNGKTMAIAAQHELVPWAIYRQEFDRAATVSPISGPSPFEPSPVERKYALSLMKRTSTVDTMGHRRTMGPRQNSSTYGAAIVQDAARSSPSDYYTQIKDIRERSYVVLIVEVVNIWANDSEKVVIDVTDYTSNQDLYNFGNDGREGDPFNYMGSSPKRKRLSGQMTLRVTLWDAHAEYARENLMLNDFVRLRKVHIKRSRANGTLEAVLHAERHNPTKVNVSKIQSDFDSDKNVLELSKRKNAYWGKRGSDAPEDNGDISSKSTKPNKKKKKEKRDESTVKEDQKPLVIGQRSKINQNVQAAYPGIKTQRIEDILTKSVQTIKSPDGIEYELPFQNIRYRSVIRVVDFFPPKLEDFAVPRKSKQTERPASDDDDGNNDDSNGFVRWNWRFCLLVESAAAPPPGESRERMPLFVAGPEAEYLLRMDAVNLREDKTALKALKEKLFILWGDLEEQKSKAIAEGNTKPDSFGPVSFIPFTCCIKEYGVRCSHSSGLNEMVVNHESGCNREDCLGWEKRFAMFETTIMTP